MAEITAKLVNELRAKTGQGMMECKKMLTEAAGDLEKAIEGFRKKGVKASIAERTASEGRVIGVLAPDAKSGALVEVNCNTDFTARSEPIQHLGAAAGKLLLNTPGGNVAEAPEVASKITEVAQQTGENVRLGRTAVLSSAAGKVGMYLYGVTGKIGVLVAVSANASDELVRDLCLHITAKNPLALKREELPADLVAKERDFSIRQATESGKPQNIAEKIAEGKMRTFYEERVLLDQEFVNPDKFKGSVAQLLKASNASLEKYLRVEVGQGS